MRLLINGLPLLTPHSGVGYYTLQLSKALALTSNEVKLAFFYGLYFSNSMKVKVREPYMSLWRVAKRSANSYLAFQIVKDTVFKIASSSRKMDVYHETNHIPMPFKGPIVVTMHDLSLHLWPETHPKGRRQHYQRYFYRRLPWATHFITVSESTKKQMVEHLDIKPDKITVTHNGVDNDLRKMPVQEAEAALSFYGLAYGSYILYVGTLEPRKNISALLEAYSFLPKKTQAAFPLILAGGKGWLMDNLEDEIRRLDIASTTVLTGYVPREHLPALYSGATVFVYPSLYEGFGLPPLEAMACGTPVITSNVSSLPEVVGDAGIMVDPYDVKRLRDEIERVLEDSSLRASLGDRGVARAKHFTWENCARQTLDVYNRVIDTRG
jgi:glycosyltransferase involved in cell wall biosynthesis